MKTIKTLLIICLLLALCRNNSAAQYDARQLENNSIERLLLKQAIEFGDTISIYFDYDIIYLEPISNHRYIIQSEVSDYPIGVLNSEDTYSLLWWSQQYPITTMDVPHGNLYYQELIEQKVWE